MSERKGAPVTDIPSTDISAEDVIRCAVSLRTPFSVRHLPPLSRLHRAAFRVRRRLSKRFVGKPAKRLFRLALALGLGGEGRVGVRVGGAEREVRFNARNTQFGAFYLPQSLPVYEPETSALLDRLVADDSVFVDVGANWGWYSLLVASRPGFSGTVHAFEPFPETFRDLASVVEQAGLADRVRCHDVALADQDGESSMAFSDGVQSGLARLGEEGGTKVRLARLDTLGLPDADVIKIDAEDHELEVLVGARAVLERARPFVVFENWLHRDRPALTLDPFALLAGLGYRFFYPGWVAGGRDCIDMKPPADGRTELALVPFLPVQRFQLPGQLNVLAVHPDRLAELRRRLG